MKACVSLLLLAAACGGEAPDVATYRVEPAAFSRRVTAEGTLQAVKATPVAVPQNATAPMKVSWVADDGALVHSGDTIIRFDRRAFEDLLLNGREDHSTASNKLDEANAQSSATRTNLGRDARLAQADLEAARRYRFDDGEVFSRFARIEAEVDQELAVNRKRHAEEVLGVRDDLARVERDLLAIEDRRAGLKIRQAEEGLRALEVVAPHDGLLVLERNWRGELPRVGDTMWRGQPVGEIPELDSMQAQVFVLEADAAGLAAGQKATLFLEADPSSRFEGTIKSVDKVARPRIPRQPVQYFGVTIALERTNPRLMKPGARVRALLELEKNARAFAIPRQALFDKDGRKLVYRRKGTAFEPVEVTAGTSSAGRVVITKGLAAGDVIALQDPSAEADGPRGRGATDGKA
jgi:HlyD family secretion protein